MVRQADEKASVSNSPSSFRNFMRFKEERLQAVSSRNMYSLHGFEALMRAVFGQVCQSLMVVSNCIPGSPHCHAASAIIFIMSRARKSSQGPSEITYFVCHSRSSTTARMKSSVTRTEWLAFWKNTES